MPDDLELDESRFNVGNIVKENPIPSGLLLTGLILFGIAAFFLRGNIFTGSNIEVIETDSEQSKTYIVEVAGAVDTPGVYEMEKDSRVSDALSAAGGLTDTADTTWVEKTLNRAAKITDGQKIYIPSTDSINDTNNKHSEVASAKDFDQDQTISSPDSTKTETLVNINDSTQSELEELWGIGPVTGKKIIEQRPYSKIEELLEKGILKQNVYDRNKDLMTVY